MNQSTSPGGLGAEADSLTGKRTSLVDAEFDLTPMVDLVFSMTIFFLITALGAMLADVDLPAAKYVTTADEDNSVVVTMVIRGDPASPILFVGDEDDGPAITDIDEQVERVTAAVEAGPVDDNGAVSVLLKAERKVRYGDIMRIASAVGAVEDAKLYVAVMEMD